MADLHALDCIFAAAGLRACALGRAARAAGFRLNSRRRWLSRWRAGTCGTGSLLHAGILWDTVHCPGPPVELRVCIVRASRLCGGIPSVTVLTVLIPTRPTL